MSLITSTNFSNFFQTKTRIVWNCSNVVDLSNLPVFHYLCRNLDLVNPHVFLINKFFLLLAFFFVFVYFVFKNNFFTKSLAICEEEINSSDDFLLVFSLVFFFFFFNFYGFFCLSYFSIFNVLAHLFGFLLLSLLLMPLTALYNFGFYFIINIKGSAVSLSYFYELIQDNINLLSFFLRIYIQLVRLITITVTYFGYNHLVLSYNFDSIGFDASLSSFVLSFLRFTFELVHTIIIFIAQTMSLLMMVLWLFQFLFTMFVNRDFELTYRRN